MGADATSALDTETVTATISAFTKDLSALDKQLQNSVADIENAACERIHDISCAAEFFAIVTVDAGCQCCAAVAMVAAATQTEAENAEARDSVDYPSGKEQLGYTGTSSV